MGSACAKSKPEASQHGKHGTGGGPPVVGYSPQHPPVIQPQQPLQVKQSNITNANFIKAGFEQPNQLYPKPGRKCKVVYTML